VVLIILFIPLIFQELRYEGYETEKGAFVIMVGGIIVAHWLKTSSNMTKTDWAYWLRNPFHGLICLFVISTGLSTIFALSPLISINGIENHAHAWLQIAISVVVFLNVERTWKPVLHSIGPILVSVSLPISLYTIIQSIQSHMVRPSATFGHPNFLASWLIIAIVIICTWAYWHIQTKAYFKRAGVIFYAVIILLILTALILTGSRGATLAFVTSIIIFMLFVIALRKKRRALIYVFAFIFFGSISYLIVSALSTENYADSRRLFEPVDQFRIITWNLVGELVATQHVPLEDFAGNLDPLSFIRPIFGYGYGDIPQLQSRFGPIYGPNIFLDSTHNFLFDTFLQSGFFSVILVLFIYITIIKYILKQLGLFDRPSNNVWYLVQFVCVFLCIFVLRLLLPDLSLWSLLPLGTAFVFSSTLTIWLTKFTFTYTKYSMPISFKSLALISSLALVIAHWIDLQFGFVLISSELLLWICFGLILSAHGAKDEQFRTVEWDKSWRVGASVTGLFLIHSLGFSIQSRYIQHQVGGEALLLLLICVAVVAFVGEFLTLPNMESYSRLQKHLKIYLIWIIFFFAKGLINLVGGALLDEAITRASIHLGVVVLGALVLSLKGVLSCLIASFIVSSRPGIRDRKFFNLRAVLSSAILLSGIFYYMSNNASATLHAIANSLSATRSVEGYESANVLYNGAEMLAPYNPRIELQHAAMLVNWSSDFPAEMQSKFQLMHHHINRLFSYHPYYNNTLEFSLFYQSYLAVDQ